MLLMTFFKILTCKKGKKGKILTNFSKTSEISHWTKGTYNSCPIGQVYLLDNCLLGLKSYWTSVSLEQ